ncbi:MAG TPA: hypothetical protein VIG99_12650 [Myxococcaceae bacterium]|jgi:hypothetical protein
MGIAKKFLVLFAVCSAHLALADQPRLVPEGDTLGNSAPGDSGSAWGDSGHKTVFKTHPLPMMFGMAGGLLMVPVELEFAVHPNAGLYVLATPFLGAASGFAMNAGAHLYVSGNAPDGFWIGGQVGATMFPSGVSLDLQPQLGWQWVHDSGFTIGIGTGVSLASIASQRFPLVFSVPVGFAW